MVWGRSSCSSSAWASASPSLRGGPRRRSEPARGATIVIAGLLCSFRLAAPGRWYGAEASLCAWCRLSVHSPELGSRHVQRVLPAFHLNGHAAVFVLRFEHVAVAPRRGGLVIGALTWENLDHIAGL